MSLVLLCVSSFLFLLARAQLPTDDLPRPCCLPFRFSAIITPLAQFSANNKVVSRVYRDWRRKIQIQESVSFDQTGVTGSANRIYMDFDQKVRYMITSEGGCSKSSIDFAMLEPCMPVNATYLGESYLGYFDNQASFQTFNFQRSDHNRNVDMTVAVTSDRCVPVMEHIKGTLGSAHADTLIMFSNFTRTVEDSVFDLPDTCLH